MDARGGLASMVAHMIARQPVRRNAVRWYREAYSADGEAGRPARAAAGAAPGAAVSAPLL